MTEQQELLVLYDKLMGIHKIKKVIESCECLDAFHNDDTKAFIQSVRQQFESKGHITEKQFQALQNISEADHAERR